MEYPIAAFYWRTILTCPTTEPDLTAGTTKQVKTKSHVGSIGMKSSVPILVSLLWWVNGSAIVVAAANLYSHHMVDSTQRG